MSFIHSRGDKNNFRFCFLCFSSLELVLLNFTLKLIKMLVTLPPVKTGLGINFSEVIETVLRSSHCLQVQLH